jgi:hypothetical protein
MARGACRLFAAALAVSLAACAEPPPPSLPATSAPSPLQPAATRLFPECGDEIRAFLDLTRIARQYGDGWEVFEDAIDTLQEQLVDCINENYPPALDVSLPGKRRSLVIR